MKLHIKQLVVWPADPELMPRVVDFHTDKVSVVTGWSGTGKSSIIAIINYVLGSESCTIPVGEIRDYASWYGLVLETDAGPMRVARRKPDGRAVSTAMWFQQGPDTAYALPPTPHQNATPDRFKQIMNALSGLSDLRLDPDESGGYKERASFRDMASFNFLPQHIVANPNTMFFKADSFNHRDKLRNILPLALGVVTNEELIRAHELSLLREELRKLETELKARRNGLENWRSSANGAFFRAQELSLIPAGDPPADLSELIGILRRVVAAGGRTVNAPGRVSATVQRLELLKQNEQSLDKQIQDQKRRLRRLRGLRRSVSDFEEVLEEQKARVEGVGWFQAKIIAEECVLCGSGSEAARHTLSELDAPIAELAELSAGTESTAPMVDNEILAIQRALLEDERALLNVRRTRLELETAVDAERGASQSLEAVYRFIGSTEQALKMLADVDGDGGLQARANKLSEQIQRRSAQLDEAKRIEREETISRRVTSYIKRFVEFLAIKGAGGTPMLDQRELSLRFAREEGAKPDYLWEIGSGENWMGYHLATLLALHSVFLFREDSNPVPTFLVIDQPSQVYFPSDTFEDIVEGRAPVPATGRPRRHLNDLESTKQIFRALARAQKSFEGRLQIIVLDHADQIAWGELDNVASSGNWRGDADYLIPAHWITQPSQDPASEPDGDDEA
jgi:hypothetical protein